MGARGRSEGFALSPCSLIWSTTYWDVKAGDIHGAGQLSPGVQSCSQHSAVCRRKSIRARPRLFSPLSSCISPYSVCAYAKSTALGTIIPPTTDITVSKQQKVTSITDATERAFIAPQNKYRQAKYLS